MRLVVVIVQIQTWSTHVHLNGLFFIPQLGRQNAMHTWRQTGLMHSHGFVKVKVGFNHFITESIFKEIQSLQNISLLYKTTSQNAIPTPMLIDWTLCWIEIWCFHQYFIQKSILLQEDLTILMNRIMHLGDNTQPFSTLFQRPIKILDRSIVLRLMFALQSFDTIISILQTPHRNVIGVPIIIDVILIFIGTCYTMHHILLLMLTPMHPLCPESSDTQKHFPTGFIDICFITSILGVVVNGISNGTISVNFLKGNFPFIMALFTVHRDHRIQRCPIGES